MNMFDILREAQGGNGIDNLASRFGLGRQETEQVLQQVLPALSAGFKQRTQDASGLESLLTKIQGTDYEDVYEDPSALQSEATRARGNDVLNEVFGSKDVSRAVAQRTEFASGVGSTVVKAMLPMIASMILGGMQRKTSRDGGMGGILGTLIGGLAGGGARRGGGGGGLDDLLGAVLGGGGARQAPAPQPRGGGLGGILGGLLGGARSGSSGGGGGGLGGVLGGLLGGGGRTRQPAPQSRTPQGGGGLDDLLGGILGSNPRQRRSTGDRNLDNVLGMFDSDGDGTVDREVLRELGRRR